MCSAAPRSRHLKYLVPRIICCFLYSCTSSSVSAASEDGGEEGEMAMGPMTLQEYISTLEPYNPWVHGWRGNEPRRVWQPTLPPPTPLPQRKHSATEKSQSTSGKNRRHAHK